MSAGDKGAVYSAYDVSAQLAEAAAETISPALELEDQSRPVHNTVVAGIDSIVLQALEVCPPLDLRDLTQHLAGLIDVSTDASYRCWVCLDAGSTDAGPLVRGCACRGSSGWAHGSCIACASAAADRNAMATHREQTSLPMCASVNSIREAWDTCSMCKTEFVGGLAYSQACARWKQLDESMA